MRAFVAFALSVAIPSMAHGQSVVTLGASLYGATAMVFDEARNRLVFFVSPGAIVEWDGQHWATSGATLPTPAIAMRAIYDSRRDRILVFTGQGYSSDHLWSFDGQAFVDLGATPGLTGAVYDSSRGCIVAVAWGPQLVEWDGQSWHTVVAAGAFDGRMAFDEQRGLTVLVSASNVETTSEWDGAALVPRATGPIVQGRLVYDPTRRQVLRIDANIQAWTGTAWVGIAGGLGYPPRHLATDRRRGLVWRHETDLSGWNGVGWVTSVLAPHPPQAATNFTFDGARGRGVLCGGLSVPAGVVAEWTGNRWIRQQPVGAVPAARTGHSQVFDPLRGETFVFGGSDGTTQFGDTWAWNGTSWRQLATTGPSPRFSAPIAYDAGRQRIVIVGGWTQLPNTPASGQWEWDGATWTQWSGAPPSMGFGAALGYDTLRQRLVLHVLFQTFEFDGNQWSLADNNSPLRIFGSATLVWNSARQRVQGTAGVYPNPAQLLEWDGTQWTPLALLPGDIAYDPLRNEVLACDQRRLVAWTSSPANAAQYGLGCGNASTMPFLTTFGSPRLGESGFHLDVRGEPARPLMIGFGSGPGMVPIGNGCALLLQSPLGSIFWFTDAYGFFHCPWPLPGSVALTGLSVFAQAAVIDPSAAGSVALSPGLAITLGS